MSYIYVYIYIYLCIYIGQHDVYTYYEGIHCIYNINKTIIYIHMYVMSFIHIYIYPIGFRMILPTGLWSVTPGLLQTSIWLQYNHSHEAIDFHMGYIVLLPWKVWLVVTIFTSQHNHARYMPNSHDATNVGFFEPFQLTTLAAKT